MSTQQQLLITISASSPTRSLTCTIFSSTDYFFHNTAHDITHRKCNARGEKYIPWYSTPTALYITALTSFSKYHITSTGMGPLVTSPRQRVLVSSLAAHSSRTHTSNVLAEQPNSTHNLILTGTFYSRLLFAIPPSQRFTLHSNPQQFFVTHNVSHFRTS